MPHLWVPHLAQREGLGNAASYCPDSRLPQRLCKGSLPFPSKWPLAAPSPAAAAFPLGGEVGVRTGEVSPLVCVFRVARRNSLQQWFWFVPPAPCHKPGVAWFIAWAALAINPQSSPALIYWYLLAWVWGVVTKDDGDGSLTQYLELMNMQLTSKDQVSSFSL